MRLERYIFVYSYLVRLILKELEKKRGIAYLSVKFEIESSTRPLSRLFGLIRFNNEISI